MIEKSKSVDWPNGQAWLVTKQLLKKFKPTDRISKSELDSDIMSLKLKVESDPATLFENISALEVQYEVELDLDRVVAIVMRVSPEMYHTTLVTEQRIQGDTLEREDLEDVMHDLWRIGNTKNSEDDSDTNDDKEMSMAAFQAMFKGKCFTCGKEGHRSNE